MEKYLGESKYDGKIRRITLIKKVADILSMEDGDYISYFLIDDEIIIRKNKTKNNSISINEMIPKYCSPEEAKLIIDTSFEISKYYYNKKEPTNNEKIEIQKILNSNLYNVNTNKQEEMCKSCIEIARNITSKI